VAPDAGREAGFYFRDRVILIPCIRSGFTASLAGRLWNRSATPLCAYSEFDTEVEIQKIDARQLDGLADFYKRAANECTRIDLCIHCLGFQRVKHAGLGFEAGLDARTILMGTLLAARHLAKKELARQYKLLRSRHYADSLDFYAILDGVFDRLGDESAWPPLATLG
jgi:hypothetical protein